MDLWMNIIYWLGVLSLCHLSLRIFCPSSFLSPPPSLHVSFYAGFAIGQVLKNKFLGFALAFVSDERLKFSLATHSDV